MTDYPRFRIPQGAPDRAYLHYFGAPQVELLFRLIDTWQSRAELVQRPSKPILPARWFGSKGSLNQQSAEALRASR